jgi:hypothetical protein
MIEAAVFVGVWISMKDNLNSTAGRNMVACNYWIDGFSIEMGNVIQPIAHKNSRIAVPHCAFIIIIAPPLCTHTIARILRLRCTNISFMAKVG